MKQGLSRRDQLVQKQTQVFEFMVEAELFVSPLHFDLAVFQRYRHDAQCRHTGQMVQVLLKQGEWYSPQSDRSFFDPFQAAGWIGEWRRYYRRPGEDRWRLMGGR